MFITYYCQNLPCSTNRSAARRRGHSLVELTVSMTGGAVIFALAVGAIQQTMRLSRHTHDQVEHQQAMARLGEQFRRDVHAASAIVVQPQNIELTTATEPVGKVTYRVGGRTITREATQAETASVSREQFALADNCRLQFTAIDTSTYELNVVRMNPEGERLESHVLAKMNRWGALRDFDQEQP